VGGGEAGIGDRGIIEEGGRIRRQEVGERKSGGQGCDGE